MRSPLNQQNRTPAKINKNQVVIADSGSNGHRPQGELFAVAEIEVDGVQMGVLNDGTPYLTLRGLARMCGIDHTVLLRLANNWEEEREKPRGRRIQQILDAQGYKENFLYTRTAGSTADTHAYTDAVCMAVLEYYAFDSAQGSGNIALQNYRILARDSFRNFIYKRCQFDPQSFISDSWKNFHERVLLNDQLPVGFFSIFKEIADLVVRMIQQGCTLDDHTIPDQSVGMIWSRYWGDQLLDDKYGKRIKHPHYYPDWFPQSAINPVEAWIYPVDALGEFHKWMHRTYLPEKFPNYLGDKVKKGVFLPAVAQSLIAAVKRPELKS